MDQILLLEFIMEERKSYENKQEGIWPFISHAWILFFTFIFLLSPSIGFTKSIYLDIPEGEEGEVTISGDGTIESSGYSRVSFAQGQARSILENRLLTQQSGSSQNRTCENIKAVSIRDINNDLLGTATLVGDGIFITARHVFAGNVPVGLRDQSNTSAKISEKFKRYFQIIDRRTNKVLDLLFISQNENTTKSSIQDQLRQQISIASANSGAKWSSCQYGIHGKNSIFSQYSEGQIKLISEDSVNFYLGVSKLDGAISSDLTTFGSSGASVWLYNSDSSSVGGVVSCLQAFNDNHSGRTIYFPKVISLLNIFKSDEYLIEETTLEELHRSPQEADKYCPFTDGKGGGGFLKPEDPHGKEVLFQGSAKKLNSIFKNNESINNRSKTDALNRIDKFEFNSIPNKKLLNSKDRGF